MIPSMLASKTQQDHFQSYRQKKIRTPVCISIQGIRGHENMFMSAPITSMAKMSKVTCHLSAM